MTFDDVNYFLYLKLKINIKIKINYNMEFTSEQQFVFNKYKQGENIFITGPGGVGKSELIKFIYEDAKACGKNIVVTATTGCAAIRLNCNARTIHSWAGIGLGNKTASEFVRKFNPFIKGLWRNIDILVIDEVSMLSMKLFQLLNNIAKKVRNNPSPYGGIQVIFSGDFYQLPPVGDKDVESQCFCFESPEWNTVFPCQTELTRIFRQNDVYAKILNQIRQGIIKKSADRILRERVGLTADSLIIPTKLYPTKLKVDIINRENMERLSGEERVFKITHVGPSSKEAEMECEMIKKGLLCDHEIILKEGAQVMCIINIQNEKVLELCNGSQGIVTSFTPDGYPVVQFQNGIHRPMLPHIWESEKIVGVGISQLPLILAWAISIHKSQGSTLDMAEVDIGSGIFECGQSYVALSRVKSLEGLYLSSYDPSKIKINQKVKKYYDSI